MILGVCLLAIACKRKPKTVQAPVATQDSISYFAVTDALQKEIAHVLKTPYYIYIKTEATNGTKDSVGISTQEFETLVQPVLQFNLNSKENLGQFTETIFEDLSTQSITFMYAPKQASSSIANVTVLLNNESQALKSVYIKTVQPFKDSAISTQYFWKSNKSVTVTKITDYVTSLNKKSFIQKQLISWNDK